MTNRTALDQARAELTVIEAELHVLAAAKADAVRSPTLFTKWKVDHDAKLAEQERLIALIETLEQEVAVIESDEAEEALRKHYSDRKAANEKLAQRIRADLKKANSILLALVRDVAEGAVEDSQINAELPDDLEPLVPARVIACGRPPMPRLDIGTTRIWLWTTLSGTIIGDQDSVTDLGNGRGKVGEGAYYTGCVAALFDQTEYHPAEQAERPQPLWQMRLPQPDAPGFAFDGTRCNYPADALAEIARGARTNEPRERPVEIELRPVPSIEKEVA